MSTSWRLGQISVKRPFIRRGGDVLVTACCLYYSNNTITQFCGLSMDKSLKFSLTVLSVLIQLIYKNFECLSIYKTVTDCLFLCNLQYSPCLLAKKRGNSLKFYEESRPVPWHRAALVIVFCGAARSAPHPEGWPGPPDCRHTFSAAPAPWENAGSPAPGHGAGAPTGC